jgi:hypothetical protein
MLPGDLGVLFLLQALFVTSKAVSSPALDLTLDRAEILFGETGLFLNELGGVGEG